MTREAIHSGGIRTELDRTFSKKNRLSQGLENVGAGSSGGVTFLAEWKDRWRDLLRRSDPWEVSALDHRFCGPAKHAPPFG